MGLRAAALLDTSVVVKDLGGAPAPETAAVSVVTLGELRAGVELADTPDRRRSRQQRLLDVRKAFVPLPVDEDVADQYGRLLAFARRERRMTKATDLLIIATAMAKGRLLATHDDRQARLAEAAGVELA